VIHYTLNSGNVRTSPRSEVADHVIAAMAPFVLVGDHRLPGPLGDRYRLVVPAADAGFLATVFRDQLPLVTIAVAGTEADAHEMWPAIEGLYLSIYPDPLARVAPERPATLPWCAVVVVNAAQLGDAVRWLGDFERCLAWTWLESNSR
jgi:hypothetical protein